MQRTVNIYEISYFFCLGVVALYFFFNFYWTQICFWQFSKRHSNRKSWEEKITTYEDH